MQKKNILIVDDDPTFRAMIRHALEERGYGVVEQASGFHTNATIREYQVSLVILDILMEEHDGMETITEIRDAFPNLPVVVISVDPFYLSIIPHLGANESFLKPIDLKKVLPAIDRWLGGDSG